MLNRTNRTLSANSNRLNLGTRSFALVLGGNMGQKSLRIRQIHPQPEMETARAGSFTRSLYPPTPGEPGPVTPGSSLVCPGLAVSPDWRAWAAVVADPTVAARRVVDKRFVPGADGLRGPGLAAVISGDQPTRAARVPVARATGG